MSYTHRCPACGGDGISTCNNMVSCQSVLMLTVAQVVETIPIIRSDAIETVQPKMFLARNVEVWARFHGMIVIALFVNWKLTISQIIMNYNPYCNDSYACEKAWDNYHESLYGRDEDREEELEEEIDE